MTKADAFAAELLRAACPGGRAFLKTQPTLADAFDRCPRGDWLIWGLHQLPADRAPTHTQWVRIALACAERALPAFTRACPNDNRPRKALEAVRTWLETQNDIGLRTAAAGAADAAARAVYAAYAAARAACATARAACAACADTNAAVNAACAVYDAGRAVVAYTAEAAANTVAYAAEAGLSEFKWQADAIRQIVPNPFRKGPND